MRRVAIDDGVVDIAKSKLVKRVIMCKKAKRPGPTARTFLGYMLSNYLDAVVNQKLKVVIKRRFIYIFMLEFWL